MGRGNFNRGGWTAHGKTSVLFEPKISVVSFSECDGCSLDGCVCVFLYVQWHALSREEQAKYYELARKERQLHMQLYPGWSARDNYVSF